MPVALQFGSKLIRDITRPEPSEIDVAEIRPRLAQIRRFSNNPISLTVFEHVRLCVLLSRALRMPDEITQYLYHHDDHEAIIGDIPGPLKALIAAHTNVLAEIENALDKAIWEARGKGYRLPGTADAFAKAHHIDKLAESLEWRLVMFQPKQPWNRPFPPEIDGIRQWLLDAAQDMRTCVFHCRIPAPKHTPQDMER